MKKKILSLLVLLVAAVSGAWAADVLNLVVDGTSATLKYDGNASNNPYLTESGLEPSEEAWEWNNTIKPTITTVTIDASCNNYNGTSLHVLFDGFSGLTTINGLENLNTVGVQDMEYIFSGCSSLTSLDLSSWNTASVTSMSFMFQGCSSLTSLDLSSWNTENVEKTNSLFLGCSELTTVDLSSWNTAKVWNTSYMFCNCSKLENIYVGDGWSTAAVTMGVGMFDGCTKLLSMNTANPAIDKTNAHTGDGGYLKVKPALDYLFTVAPCEHGSGTVKFFIDGKEVEGAMQADEGKTVTMTITPDEGWIVDATSVKAESYTTWEAAGARRRSGAPANITILGDVTLTKSTSAENTWTFTMPAASVLVSAGYIKSSTLYFDPADKTNLVKVTVDGTDRNLNGSKTVKIKRVDNVLEGTAVSLKANDGYKFRKVQVTKTDNGLKLTNPTVGQVIGSDGKNYAYASLPTGVTAVAKICYVSGNSGLALALADESSMMDWATAIETCAAHTPAFKGAEWKLASQDEWNNMKSAAGNYANLRNGFSSVGGTDMRSLQEETYWSSTEQVNSQNAWYMLNSGNWYRHDKSVTKYVRACLAF